MKKIFHFPTLSLEIIFVFLMVAGAYVFFLSSSPKDWNSNSRLALVKAIVEEGRLEIDSYHDNDFNTNDKAFYNNHYYSDKAIGSSIIGVIFYFPLYWILKLFGVLLPASEFKIWIAMLAVSLPSALLAPLLYLTVKNISQRRGFALLVTLAICLGTPYYKYSDLYYGHTLAGLLCFVSFFIWFQARLNKKISPFPVFISGFCLGLSLITEYPTALLALPLGLYLLYVLWEQNWIRAWKIYALLLAGFLIPVSILLLYNNAVFQNPFSLAYSYEENIRFQRAHSQGITGVGLPDLKVLFYSTMHPTMGIFWQSPVLLLSFVGLGTLVKKTFHRLEAFFAYGTIALYLIIMSGFYMWWGGFSFTPRHLIPVLPFFSIPLAFLPKSWFKLAGLFSVFSIGQMLIVSAGRNTGLEVVDNLIDQGLLGRYLRNYQLPPTTIYTVFWENILKGEFTPNLASYFFGAPQPATLLILVGFEILLIGLFFYVIKKGALNTSAL